MSVIVNKQCIWMINLRLLHATFLHPYWLTMKASTYSNFWIILLHNNSHYRIKQHVLLPREISSEHKLTGHHSLTSSVCLYRALPLTLQQQAGTLWRTWSAAQAQRLLIVSYRRLVAAWSLASDMSRWMWHLFTRLFAQGYFQKKKEERMWSVLQIYSWRTMCDCPLWTLCAVHVSSSATFSPVFLTSRFSAAISNVFLLLTHARV